MKITVFYDHVREACEQTGKSLAEVAQIIREHGVSGVEMDYAQLKHHTGKKLRELKKAGVPVVSVYAFFDWGNHPEDRSYKKVLKKLHRHGIRYVLAVPGFVQNEKNREMCRERMADVLQDMCRYAAKMNIQVAMEDFDDASAVYARGREVKWFLERIPELSCAFDTGNFIYSEEQATKMLPMLINRIGYVHCKDRSLQEKEGETPKKTIGGRNLYSASVGSGVIPMEEILEHIIQSGYDGNYAIEHFGSKHQLADITASADWLRNVLKKYEKQEK